MVRCTRCNRETDFVGMLLSGKIRFKHSRGMENSDFPVIMRYNGRHVMIMVSDCVRAYDAATGKVVWSHGG